MATTPNSHNHPGPRRRSQRILMQVAVKIRGTDAHGRKFEEEASTLAINAHGALMLLQARLTSGSAVVMQHKQTEEEQECHVVFLGPVRAGQGEIGLEFSEPRPTPRGANANFARVPEKVKQGSQRKRASRIASG